MHTAVATFTPSPTSSFTAEAVSATQAPRRTTFRLLAGLTAALTFGPVFVALTGCKAASAQTLTAEAPPRGLTDPSAGATPDG